MRRVSVSDSFEEWRTIARELLRQHIQPSGLTWVQEGAPQIFLEFSPTLGEESPSSGLPAVWKVPKRFLSLAHFLACHRAVSKWPLLYRILWRLTHDEPRLLENPLDEDVLVLNDFSQAVSRDVHRMRAFVRFRASQIDGQPWWIAWYEPEHPCLPLNEDFFVDRFFNMKWSILTPDGSLHWNGDSVDSGPAAPKPEVLDNDTIEPLWITYYSSAFNPARANPRALQAQMPKRNWKNLPESIAIEPLLRQAPVRIQEMLKDSETLHVRDDDYTLASPPAGAPLVELAQAAGACQACPLWKCATSTVFGEGPADARIVLVGEQPGDQEDRAERPFVGPAGQLLGRALAQAGLERSRLYLTNAVKHFKWEPRGKRRLHQTPNSRDISACRPWLEAELVQIKPALIIALGATAAMALFEDRVRISEARGLVQPSRFGPILVTVHPSALLRLTEPHAFAPEFARFVSELHQAKDFDGRSGATDRSNPLLP